MIMRRSLTLSLVALALVASSASAQDGPLRRIGRGLDQTGKNIRYQVETGVARGETIAEERDVLGRVTRRIEWDKKLAGSALRVEVQADGTVVLRGSVTSDAAKRRAVDIAENTVGVAAVVDGIAVAKEVPAIESKPAARVIELTPPAAKTQVVVPPETEVIVKP
jgi:hyperosmotically inducible periplasmic protein